MGCWTMKNGIYVFWFLFWPFWVSSSVRLTCESLGLPVSLVALLVVGQPSCWLLVICEALLCNFNNQLGPPGCWQHYLLLGQPCCQLLFCRNDFICALCVSLGTMGDSSGTNTAPSSSSNVSLSHHAPAQRITSVLLNGQNFASWS